MAGKEQHQVAVLRVIHDPDQPLIDMLTHMYPEWDISLREGQWTASRRRLCNCPRTICHDNVHDLIHDLGELDLACRPTYQALR